MAFQFRPVFLWFLVSTFFKLKIYFDVNQL